VSRRGEGEIDAQRRIACVQNGIVFDAVELFLLSVGRRDARHQRNNGGREGGSFRDRLNR